MDNRVWIMILCYLAAMIGIGVWAARRKVSTYEDMTVAGRSVGPFLIGCSVAATWINGATLITHTGLGKSFGLSSYWHTGAVCIGTLWAGIFLIPRMWKLRVITTPQIFERFFGPLHRVAALIISMMRDFGATAGTMGATAVIAAAALNLTTLESLVLTYFVTVLYVTLGGMWAVLLTDMLQFFILMAGTLLLLSISLSDAGGFGAVADKAADPALFSLFGNFGFTDILGWFAIGFFIACGYQSLAQRAFAARSREAARRGFIYGGIFATAWYMVPPLLGVTGVALLGKEVEADQVFVQLNGRLSDPYLQGLLFVAIMSANMSTLSSTIGAMGSNVAVDIFQRFLRPSAGAGLMLWVSRLSILVTSVLAALVYYFVPMLLELFLAGARLVAGSLAPVLIALFLVPPVRSRPNTVLAALVLSAAAVIAGQLWVPRELQGGASFFVWLYDPTLLGIAVAPLVLLIGGLLEGPRRHSTAPPTQPVEEGFTP